MHLTHLDSNNNPTMVDVSEKNITSRVAIASGKISMSKDAYSAIINSQVKKGPVLQTAIVSAIMGAKKTSDIIPMCHPLFLNSVKCDVENIESECSFRLIVSAKVDGKTGVEMAALSGVRIGLLTIYDMVKAIEKSKVISDIRLEATSG